MVSFGDRMIGGKKVDLTVRVAGKPELEAAVTAAISKVHDRNSGS